jgi:putative hemolysin
MVRAASPRDHIIDVLIAERAPRLAASPAWAVARPLLYALLDYPTARRMADAIAPMGGAAALDLISDHLRLKVGVSGLERLPRSGRLIVVCNHPTGIGDGVAVRDILGPVRRDLVFYANSDAHRVAPRFSDVLIPVEWREDKRTRERTRLTLAMTREAMEAERALMIFPAGRVARSKWGRNLGDLPWASGAFSVARKFDAPVVPMHLAGPWSTLFHFFHGFSRELRDITLFHEMLNKRGKAFHLTIGHPIPQSALPLDSAEAARVLQTYVERVLPTDPQGMFT